jgi:2-oxoglutarate ferredoxin oxidoreductase subunit gamma
MQYKILIAGTGGQGVLLAGKLLSLAALIDHWETTWFPAYGAEMRSGVAHCLVIISDQFIGSPISKMYDAVIAMNSQSCEAYLHRIVPGGLMLVDSDLVTNVPQRNDISIFALPALRISAGLGSQRSANILLAGALAGKVGRPSLAAMKEALGQIGSHQNPQIFQINNAALEKGFTHYVDQKSQAC